MNGELLTLWTIRLSLMAYAIVLLGMLGSDWRAHRFVVRWFWTAGFLLLVVHVLCAFHFYHDWSHHEAFEQTAAETESLLGWRFGGGVYFNYLLIAVWCFDVAWWWIAASRYERRSRKAAALVHGYIYFIVFNGTVVFESGPTRWAGIGVTTLLAVLIVRRIRLKSPAG